ncbi:uncharacterized protein LOC118453339 isoform X1 [Egretta garzetta]|uniref:uncharacterized protein LOC118453339 isoform X1 n=1 Tax=Egretta garzetta TaxID=188379 RepID=UPI00163C0AC8|nr:uncharacterized protein LOC118453339 isoform X1 [Egretta garzetta]
MLVVVAVGHAQCFCPAYVEERNGDRVVQANQDNRKRSRQEYSCVMSAYSFQFMTCRRNGAGAGRYYRRGALLTWIKAWDYAMEQCILDATEKVENNVVERKQLKESALLRGRAYLGGCCSHLALVPVQFCACCPTPPSHTCSELFSWLLLYPWTSACRYFLCKHLFDYCLCAVKFQVCTSVHCFISLLRCLPDLRPCELRAISCSSLQFQQKGAFSHANPLSQTGAWSMTGTLPCDSSFPVPPLEITGKVHVLLVLRAPELDAGLQGRSHRAE